MSKQNKNRNKRLARERVIWEHDSKGNKLSRRRGGPTFPFNKRGSR